jgi:hypothetical protein
MNTTSLSKKNMESEEPTPTAPYLEVLTSQKISDFLAGYKAYTGKKRKMGVGTSEVVLWKSKMVLVSQEKYPEVPLLGWFS